MAQGKRQVRGRREGQDGRSREIFEIAMAQRRHDSFGKRLRTFDLEELGGMSAAEPARVRANGWLVLPDMVTMHGPLRYDVNGETPCPCEDCEGARAAWRERTGIE